jgi:uncharacterized protein YbaP (TraB family)
LLILIPTLNLSEKTVMNRFLILTLLVVSTTGSVTAQKSAKRPNYKLLWKISGKGLRAPSYLFGTMHVQDNKAFDFSDSVLLKISECEAFAMEVHPDSITRLVLTVLLAKKDKQKNTFREMLTPGEFARLDSLMSKRTGYSLNKFNSPAMTRFFLQNRAGKKDKNTFLDAWLYRIAREQGKIILGLEDGRKQFEAMDMAPAEDIEYLIKYLESNEDIIADPYQSFLDTYHRGDIDEMRKVIMASTNAEKYRQLITDRNVGMVNNIKKEIHEHSTFVAVGAGHLPGEEGIVHLLQNEGYKVTLMEPRFTGLATKYKYKASEEKWYVYTTADAGYSVEMPQQPMAFKPDTLPLSFQTYIDLGGSAIYMSTHLAIGGENGERSSAEVLDRLEKNLKKNDKHEKSNKITVQGFEGREIGLHTNDQFFRVQLIHRSGMIYMLMAGPSREAAYAAGADKFFSSFRAMPLPKKEAHEFVHQEGAFSVYMPGEVNTRVLHPEDPETGVYTLNVFHASNRATGETCLVRYNDFPAGYISSDDSTYYANMLQTIFTQLKGTDLSSHDTDVLGFRGHTFTFKIQGNMLVKGTMVLRGNRYYLMLVTAADPGMSPATEGFISSFRFLPYEATRTKAFEFSEGITLTVPHNFALDSTTQKETEYGQKQYNILDDRTGILYMLFAEKLPRYDEEKNSDDFFERIKEGYTEEADSVISIKKLSENGYTTWEMDLVSGRTNPVKRVKAILAGNMVFTLVAYLPADHQQSSLPAKLLNSFSIRKTDAPWSLFTDKTDLILKDVTATDSVTRAEATAAITYHNFEKADLPKIYKALNVNYADDHRYSGVRSKLFSVLTEIHDETTPDFIKTVYNKLPDSTQLKDEALSALAGMNSEEAFEEMLLLLKTDASTRKFSGYTILNSFYDSLSALNAVLPDLLSMESRFEYAYPLFYFARAALDSGVLQPDVKNKVIGEILAIGRKAVADLALQKKDTLDDSRLSLIAGMLSAVPFSPDVKNMLTALHRSGDIPVMVITTTALLKNNISLPQGDLDKIAAEPLYRFRLYEALKAIKKEKLIASRHLTTEKFAESEFYEFMDSEDEVLERAVLLNVKKILYQEEKQDLYVYKYKYSQDDTWYIGVSGPYSAKSKGIPPQHGDLTSATYEAYENDKQLDDVLKTLLADYEAKLVE